MNVPPEPDAVLDTALFQELRESLGNDLQAVAAIHGRFLASAASKLEELRGQTGAARTPTLHALKGSAAMMGANRIAALAAQLQDTLPHAPEEIARSRLRDLDSELTTFRLALNAHLDSLGSRKKF